ncbi:sensor histidine kinase [Desulfotomaculum sp. 1211_IL3151]|uniref:sensor histidine kinase n=1 Tax=Desulfotomaculum sp. 1211_IL3151 TaxID=3084055 RepID=UPI002FDACE27
MTRQQKFRDLALTLVVIQLGYILAFVWVLYLKDHSILERYLGFRIPHYKNLELMTLIVTISTTTIFIYSLLHYFKASCLEQEYAKEKLQNELAQNTIHLLRCHRHDFLNHLQVILGYIQLNKTNKAEEYIKNINQEVSDIRVISQIQIPEVAVLLYMKKDEAYRSNIKLVFDFETDLSNISLKQTDLVRIISNLIDNAFFELKKLNASVEKIVEISFNYSNDHLVIEVFNTGSYIEDTERIFDYGYTTKGNLGSGIGLYNVKELVDKYHGSITVESDRENGTTFVVTI